MHLTEQTGIEFKSHWLYTWRFLCSGHIAILLKYHHRNMAGISYGSEPTVRTTLAMRVWMAKTGIDARRSAAARCCSIIESPRGYYPIGVGIYGNYARDCLEVSFRASGLSLARYIFPRARDLLALFSAGCLAGRVFKEVATAGLRFSRLRGRRERAFNASLPVTVRERQKEKRRDGLSALSLRQPIYKPLNLGFAPFAAGQPSTESLLVEGVRNSLKR